MKQPLVYLTITRLKNAFFQLLKSPGKLIYLLFFVGMLALSFFGRETPGAGEELRSMKELAAIAALFYGLMLLLLVLGAGNPRQNSSMFTLSDATLLFPAPLSPVAILFYGVLRQLGISLLLGVFLLFQFPMLSSVYGVSFLQMLLLIAGYALTLFFAQIINMAVYSRTSARDNGGAGVKRLAAGVAIFFVLLAILSCREALPAFRQSHSPLAFLSPLTDFFSGFPGILFPVSGWIAGMVGGILTGDLLPAGLCLLLTGTVLTGLLILLAKTESSYYEDALHEAETAFTAVSAAKEGQAAEVVPKKVRLGKTGFSRGWGASVIYEKHRMENRRSGTFLLSGICLIFGAIVIGLAALLRFADGEDFDPDAALIAVFSLGVYFLFFTTAMGRLSRELARPYLYLIPEPPFKKLLWAILESLEACALEAVVIFLPACLIIGTSPPDALLCILAHISFSLLFLSGNIALERIFGGSLSRVLTFFLYFLMLALLSVPGIALGAILQLAGFLPGFAGLFLGMILLNLPVSLLVLFLCRDLLEHPELHT